MAWLCLNFDDDSDYDCVEYTGPLETSNNGDIVIAVSTSALQAESRGSIPRISTDV